MTNRPLHTMILGLDGILPFQPYSHLAVALSLQVGSYFRRRLLELQEASPPHPLPPTNVRGRCPQGRHLCALTAPGREQPPVFRRDTQQ